MATAGEKNLNSAYDALIERNIPILFYVFLLSKCTPS